LFHIGLATGQRPTLAGGIRQQRLNASTILARRSLAAASSVADCIVRHLERSGYVVAKKPPAGGARPIGRGFKQTD
jgi:hypothetical protein